MDVGVEVEAFGEKQGEKGEGKEVATANVPADIKGLRRGYGHAVDDLPDPMHGLGNVHDGETGF